MRDYFQQILPAPGPPGRRRGPERPRAGRAVPRPLSPTWSSPTSRCPTWTASTPPRRSTGKRPVPVILVSAYHDPEFIRRAEADHILAYLVKPIKQADLEPAIAIAMRRFEQFQALRKETIRPEAGAGGPQGDREGQGDPDEEGALDEQDAFRRLQKLASERTETDRDRPDDPSGGRSRPAPPRRLTPISRRIQRLGPIWSQDRPDSLRLHGRFIGGIVLSPGLQR